MNLVGNSLYTFLSMFSDEKVYLFKSAPFTILLSKTLQFFFCGWIMWNVGRTRCDYFQNLTIFLELSFKIILDWNCDSTTKVIQQLDVLNLNLGKEPMMTNRPVWHDWVSGEQ